MVLLLLTPAAVVAGAPDTTCPADAGTTDGDTAIATDDSGEPTVRSLSAPGNRSLDDLALPEDATPTSYVEHRDWLVLAFETPGLPANVTEAGDLNATDPTGGLSVSVRETWRSTGTGQRPDSVPVEAFALVRDPGNDRFFLVGKQANLPNVDRGDELRATLRVDASDYPDASADAMVNTTVRVSEYLATVDGADDGRVRVGQSVVAGVTGSTTVPEGEEVVVRIRNDGANDSFLRQRTVQVGENGSWQVAFDLSDVAVGTEFEVAVLAGPVDIAREDAVVAPETGDVGIASFDAPTTVTSTADYAVAATVANTGNASQTTFVAYVRDGQVVDSRPVTVGANATETVTFQVPAVGTQGEYEHAVALGSGERSEATLTVIDGDTTTVTTSGTTTVTTSATDASATRARTTGAVTTDGTVTTTAVPGTSPAGTTGPNPETATTATDSQPGFGLGLALVSLLAATVAVAARSERVSR